MIEALVAITILIIGVLGPLLIATRGINDGMYARNQIAASFLAEEALETVRHIRDNNLDKSRFDPSLEWTAGLLGCTGNPNTLSGGCGINEPDSASDSYRLSGCGSQAPCDLTYDTSRRRFFRVSQVDDEDVGSTAFTRRIYVGQAADGSLQVVVAMRWYNGAAEQKFQMQTYLYANKAS